MSRDASSPGIDIGIEPDGSIVVLVPQGDPRRESAEECARELVKVIDDYLRVANVEPTWIHCGDRFDPSYPDRVKPLVGVLMDVLRERIN